LFHVALGNDANLCVAALQTDVGVRKMFPTILIGRVVVSIKRYKRIEFDCSIQGTIVRLCVARFKDRSLINDFNSRQASIFLSIQRERSIYDSSDYYQFPEFGADYEIYVNNTVSRR
jgi:hypothetical protein